MFEVLLKLSRNFIPAFIAFLVLYIHFCIVIICLVFYLIFYKILKVHNKYTEKARHILNLLYDIFSKFATYSSFFLIAIACINSFYTFTYKASELIFVNFNNIKGISSYISLTITLTVLLFIPDKVSFWAYDIISYLIIRIKKFKDIYIQRQIEYKRAKRFLVLLQPKLWVYFASIIIVIINSLEKISNTEISLFEQIRPYAFESILTVVVIDRFLNIIKKSRINKTKRQLDNKTTLPPTAKS